MQTVYNKLVRDRIPEIIEANGQHCEITRLSETDYRRALLQKLVEEAEEAATADHDVLAEELADLYEVLDALVAAYGIEREIVLAQQRRKRVERGGFERRFLLCWVEDGEATSAP